MNKEFNDLNKQPYSHQEGQQNNIAGSGQNRDANSGEGAEQPTSGLRREQELERAGGGQSQTESDRANENEDEGLRGGNSSI